MTDPLDLAARIAAQISMLEHECGRQAFVWQMHKHKGREYVPPLFVDAEFPVAPRVNWPKRKEARR